MPGNLLSVDTAFPTFTSEQSNEEKLDVVINYLYMLMEQLRYALANLGAGNFNDAELDEIGIKITQPIYADLENAAGAIADLTLTADQLTSQLEDAEGNISSIDQYARSITLNVSNGEKSSTIKLMAGGTVIASQIVKFSGTVVFEDLENEGQSVINGANLITGTVTADNIRGRYVDLLDPDGDISGTISIEPASLSDQAIRIESEGGMALDAMGGTLYLESQGRILLNPETEVECQADFLPGRDDLFPLGASSARWTDVYAVNGTIQTSDLRQKKDISYDLSRYSGVFDRLKPCSYRFRNGERIHLGFVAQDFLEAIIAEDIPDTDFAAFIRGEDENKTLGIRYTEIIPLLVDQVQMLKSEVMSLKEGKA